MTSSHPIAVGSRPRGARAHRPWARAALAHRTDRLIGALVLVTAVALAGCGDDICADVETEIGLACTPDPAGADRVLVLEVREACGTNCARSPTCTATFSGGAVQLSLHEDHCNVGAVSCDTTTCSRLVVPCTLPALREGDYPLVYRGGPAQILRVRQGGAGACRIPVPPPAP